ncbi:DNA-processing protein DprA [Mariniblastus sp.]|nr:DNA-processing protein DprA [Mariniblastus sp.]
MSIEPAAEFSAEARSIELEAAMRLHLVPGIGPVTHGELVRVFGSPQGVFHASPADIRNVPGVGPKLVQQLSVAKDSIDVRPQLDLCQQNDIRIIARSDENYPKPLAEIYDPPNMLFCHGEVRDADQVAIAIVGTRHASNYGTTVATNLATGLAMAGFTIVSGLARGIDAAAHRGALSAGGRTIAVLGGGLLKMYPPEHSQLAKEIAQSGAVLSESLPMQAPKSGSFPRRNRIVTGLCLGVIVVEAGDRSGALISARMAMEQGREVFAVPGRVDNRMSRGCHRLIRDGAKLVESIDDVLEELGPLASPAKIDSKTSIRHPAEMKLSDQEKNVLRAIGTETTDFDSIVATTGLPPARVLATISVLEVRRLVRRVTGTSFIRV